MLRLNGNDSYDGLSPAYSSGSSGPFRTFQHAAYAVRPGDTVQIRGGVYQAHSSWQNDGTAAAPITVTNYGGETVIIDGSGNTIPSSSDDVLLQIYGDWNKVSNLEVRYSGGAGVAVHGEHCTVDNVYSHHNWGSGIYVTGWYGLIERAGLQQFLINAISGPIRGPGPSASAPVAILNTRPSAIARRGTIGAKAFRPSRASTSRSRIASRTITSELLCFGHQVLPAPAESELLHARQRDPGYVTQNCILLGDEKQNPPFVRQHDHQQSSLGGERNFAREPARW